MRAIPTFLAGSAFVLLALPASANEYAAQIQRFVDENLKGWVAEASIIDAIHEQNTAHAQLDDAAIDALDQSWRSEADTGSGPMIDAILGRAISEQLKMNKAQQGDLVTEIFVMDNRGLNVGQSDVTSDYWQGDEAKWQKTFAVGPDVVFMDEIEFDDSTEQFQTQVSMSITDPADGSVIGAVTVGLNVEGLE